MPPLAITNVLPRANKEMMLLAKRTAKKLSIVKKYGVPVLNTAISAVKKIKHCAIEIVLAFQWTLTDILQIRIGVVFDLIRRQHQRWRDHLGFRRMAINGINRLFHRAFANQIR